MSRGTSYFNVQKGWAVLVGAAVIALAGAGVEHLARRSREAAADQAGRAGDHLGEGGPAERDRLVRQARP